MATIYYFAAYSGGECILKFQGTCMTVETLNNNTVVSYIDDDGKHHQVTLSPNTVWIMEEGQT